MLSASRGCAPGPHWGTDSAQIPAVCYPSHTNFLATPMIATGHFEWKKFNRQNDHHPLDNNYFIVIRIICMTFVEKPFYAD